MKSRIFYIILLAALCLHSQMLPARKIAIQHILARLHRLFLKTKKTGYNPCRAVATKHTCARYYGKRHW